jgi:hypothetical protein
MAKFSDADITQMMRELEAKHGGDTGAVYNRAITTLYLLDQASDGMLSIKLRGNGLGGWDLVFVAPSRPPSGTVHEKTRMHHAEKPVPPSLLERALKRY